MWYLLLDSFCNKDANLTDYSGTSKTSKENERVVCYCFSCHLLVHLSNKIQLSCVYPVLTYVLKNYNFSFLYPFGIFFATIFLQGEKKKKEITRDDNYFYIVFCHCPSVFCPFTLLKPKQ